jgi:hypothetical protein
MRRWLVPTLAALALVACGSDSNKSTSSPTSTRAGANQSEGGGVATASSAPTSSPSVPGNQVPRQVILTAEIDVATQDVAAATTKARSIATSAGGELFGEDSVNGPNATATLTLKVPPDRLDKVLDDIGRLGDEKRRQLKADDVTQKVVDLASRIATDEVSVNRLRDFLAKATSTADVATLEAELTRRETDLETLRGQQRTLQGQVAMATITVTLVGPVKKDTLRDLPGIGHALRAGVHALWLTIRGIAVGVAYSGPIVLSVLAIAFGSWRLIRRRRRS